jgi:apolipoprotein N-acyltransferase
MRFFPLLAATLTSAVLYGLAFPPSALRLLAWVALAPLLVALRRAKGLAEALFLAWAWTVLAAYVVGDWFPRAVSVYYDQPAVVGIGFFVGVSTLTAGMYYMAAAACYRALAQISRATLPLLAAAAWVAAELGRVQLFTGNPWALAGHSQAGVAPVVQIADATGVYGVSFVLLAVNAGLAEVWLALRAGSRAAARPALAGLGLAAAASMLVAVYGLVRLAFPPGPRPGSRSATIAIVQGNLDLGSQWRPEFYGQNLDVYLRLTYEALERGGAEVVFWPESAMTFFLDQEPLYQRAIGRVMASHGAQLVAGGTRAVGSTPPVYYNTAFLLSPDGTIVGRYDKQQLLPFAEYFPLSTLDFLHRKFGRVREFSRGAPSPPLPTAAGAAGVLICNEAMFPRLASDRVRAGAGYLVNLSNDSWVGDTKFAAIVSDIVSLRAVEQRRYLVRASTSGPSTIVDPLGRVTVATVPATRGVIVGRVEAGSTRTLYARVGDLFAIGCALVVAATLGGRVVRRQRWWRRVAA